MNQYVLKVCEAVRAAGGRALLVGGSVRDRLLGIESKDFDIEVFRLEARNLRSVLESIARVNTVGEHFSVYKLVFASASDAGSPGSFEAVTPSKPDGGRIEIDVSIPRRESKWGRGHRGFLIEGDPAMSFEEAARRRDFTINAIMYDPLTDETIDPYGGRKDFSQRVLRAVAEDTFAEDSLRVLRAVQLAARFEMTVEPSTAQLCRAIDLTDLPSERIWGEVEKLLLLASRPSIGLETARELNLLDKLFPEIGMLSRHGHSASSDRFAHTKATMDEAAKLTGELSKPQRITVMIASLCHDLGGLDAGLSHQAEVSVGPALSVMKKLGLHSLAGYDVRSQVLSLVREQRRPLHFYENRENTTDGDFRRLAQRVDLDMLYRLAKACAIGRGDESSRAEDWFLDRARRLGVEHGPPEPLLLGRHLLDVGYKPGPEMGRLLREVYELQLDGKVTTVEQALAAARRTE